MFQTIVNYKCCPPSLLDHLSLNSLLGNKFTLTMARVSPALCIPMYYFLSTLCFLDICYSSATILVMLGNFKGKKTTLYEGCSFPDLIPCGPVLVPRVSCWLLWLTITMQPFATFFNICSSWVWRSVCTLLIGAWLCGLEDSVKHTVLTLSVDSTRSSTFSVMYFCSWSSPALTPSQWVCAPCGASATTGLSPCLFIVYCLSSLPSRFCSGQEPDLHSLCILLLPVVVFYGIANFNYDRPNIGYILDILISVLFSVVIPMINPVTYSLRNKEIKGALREVDGEVDSLVISVNILNIFHSENLFFFSFFIVFHIYLYDNSLSKYYFK